MAVTQFRSNMLLPFKDFVQTRVTHENGLFKDKDISGKGIVSSTRFTFLCCAVEAAHIFSEPAKLAVNVRQYLKEKFTRSTIVNYLTTFEKLVEFVRACKRSKIPVIKDNESIKIIEDVRRKL